MLRALWGGCNGVYQKQVLARSKILELHSFSAPISTNTAINNSLRRSQYEGTRRKSRPPSRDGAYERTFDSPVSPRLRRAPSQAGPFQRNSDRPQYPRASRPPGRVRANEKASERSKTRILRSTDRSNVYDGTSDRPESSQIRVRRPDHQQGQDGEDLTEAQRIHDRYQELRQARKIPQNIARRTGRVDKRAVVDEMSRRSQYDYTMKPGGNRALRRAAKFGQNIESLEVKPSVARPQIPRPALRSDRLRSSGPEHTRRAPRELRFDPSERGQFSRKPRHAFEQDEEEVDGLSIPEDLRDDGRSFPKSRRRSFTMGRQDVRSERTPFASRDRDFSDERPALSDSRDFGRSGRHTSGDHDHEPADRRSNVPLSIPYTTPASEFLYGTSVVTAALLSSRRKLYKLYIYGGENREAHDQDNRIRNLALDRSVVVERVKGDWLRLMDKMSLGRPHNGYILEASPLPKLPITGLQRVSKPQGPLHVVIDHQSREDEEINGSDTKVKYDVGFPRYPVVLLLDGILDPGNLGAILRTAFFLGVDAVTIANRSSAPLSSVALKASAGATESLPLMSVSQPGSFIDSCQNHGWKVYAAAAPSPRQRSGNGKYFSTSGLGSPVRDHPCLLILGGEGEGLRWNIQQKADFEVGIDGQRIGKGGVDSLNVSVAAGLLCEAFLRKPTGLTNMDSDSLAGDLSSDNKVSHDAGAKVEDRLF